MKVCLDLHDFSVVNNRMDLLLKLKEYFPGFKVSMFTVPVDERRDWGPSIIRKEFLRTIRENLDWIQIIPHGLYHEGSEMKYVDYAKFRNEIVPKIEDAFGEDKLPFEKGFVAPHWRWSKDVVMALNDMGWWGAVDPRQPKMECPKRFYKYSHSIDDIDYTQDILKLHGHVYGTKNDLGLCLDNLLRLPETAEWHFITDFIENK